jgi:O-antigen/teichoic acid export membrane protein
VGADETELAGPSDAVDHGRLARGFSIQLVGRLASLLLSVVSIAITVRYLGVDRYGVLTAAVVFSGLFDAFSDIGLNAATVRRAAAGRGTVEHLIGLNLGTSVIYAVPLWVITSVAGVLVYDGRSQLQLGVVIVASSLLFRAVGTSYAPIFELASRFGPVALSDFAGRVLSIAMMIVAVRLDLGLVPFFVVQVAPTVVTTAVQMIASRSMGRFRPVFDRAQILDLVREGAPFAVIALIAVVYYRADGVALSLLSNDTEVGSYGLGYRMATTLSVVPTVFAATIFPSLIRTHVTGRDAFNGFATRAVEFMNLLAVPVATFGIVLAADFVALFASHSAVPIATVAARYLFVATALGFTNTIVAHCLMAAHDQRFLVWLSLLSLVVNIGLNIGLDAHYGAAGAGAALVATEVLSVALAFARLRHVTGFAVPWAYSGRLLVVAGIALTGWALTRNGGEGDVVAIAVFTAVFAAGMVVAGPLRPSQVRAMLGLLRRRSESA